MTLFSKPLVTSLLSGLRHQKPLVASLAALLAAAYVCINRNNRKEAGRLARAVGSARKKRHGKGRGLVDAPFFRRLSALLRIVIPSIRSWEVFYLAVLSTALVMRTFLSIRVSEVNGSIVKSIVNRDFPAFLRKLGALATLAIPSSCVNSALKFLNHRLGLCFRRRLVDHFHARYLSAMQYYKVVQIDSRISNPDQALTETLQKWGSSLAQLYSDVTKPLLDIILFSRKLSQLVGPQGPLTVIAYYFFSGVLIRAVSPAFGKLVATSQRYEGEFRHAHNRIITHNEEIAFYGGHDRERMVVDDKFQNIWFHSQYLQVKQFWMGITDGFLVKYGSVLVGYAVLGLPVFGPGSEEYLKSLHNDTSLITRDYIRNSSLLINLAKAIGRIVTSYKELQNLAGYTSLVSELDQVLHDLREGTYQRTMVDPKMLTEKNYGPGVGEMVVKKGTSVIEFHHVPIVTPNGDLLVDDVSLNIQKGMHLMIIGPNGCGKSSLFRILGDLWPMFGGRLVKPDMSKIFYIPQKPYLCAGTLRDQVIYPDTHEQMLAKGKTDADLLDLLDKVSLGHLVSREGGWDAVNDWFDVLSGGEKQRVAMARLFYVAPLFAVLDESTSAVSADVEGFMYRYTKEIGIGLITVSHRQSLWKYHDFCLRFDGRGKWEFGPMVLPDNYGEIGRT